METNEAAFPKTYCDTIGCYRSIQHKRPLPSGLFVHELVALAQVKRKRPKASKPGNWFPMHGFADVFLPDRLLAVSYTHLTLPTTSRV